MNLFVRFPAMLAPPALAFLIISCSDSSTKEGVAKAYEKCLKEAAEAPTDHGARILEESCRAERSRMMQGIEDRARAEVEAKIEAETAAFLVFPGQGWKVVHENASGKQYLNEADMQRSGEIVEAIFESHVPKSDREMPLRMIEKIRSDCANRTVEKLSLMFHYADGMKSGYDERGIYDKDGFKPFSAEESVMMRGKVLEPLQYLKHLCPG